MGEFDEFKQMAEDVDKLGDEFPADQLEEELDGNEVPADAAEPVARAAPVLDTEEVTAGGLGQPLVPEQEETVSIDKLLGLEEKAPEGETKPEQDAQPDPEPEQTQDPQPGRLEARMQELSESNRRLAEQNDLLMKRVLDDDRQPQAAPAEPEPELEPETLEYLKPYIKALTGKDIDELRQDVQPLKETIHDQQLGEFLSSKVDGFKPSDMAELRQELAKLPPGEQAYYKKGLPAAELLVRRLKDRGAFGGQSKQQKERVSPLAARHVSESSGVSQADAEDLSEDEKIRKLNAIPDEDILAMLERMQE